MGKKKPIVTPFGQWEYPGEVTIIPSNNITMQGVNYPVLGIDNLGNQELMMPGMDYTFPGDYVTEIPQMGKGGLTQWFAEEWTDIKTGKPCGRSGKDKDGRPYPACRPKKRVNETTPKTTSEMSSSEKAKFKREKTSGKRIDYNHKRREEGGEIGWLDQYQVGGEKTPLENFERIEQVNIKSKQAPWYVRYPRMFGRAVDNKLSDFGHQYAQRISNATGGSEWYKQSNPFMNLALESMNAPQLAATYAVTGKVQTPSEAMDIQNPYGAFAVNMLLDPLGGPAIAKGLAKGLAQGLPAAAKYATTRTPLKNTYKINPWAFEPNPEAYYHRSPNLENIINKETGMLQGFGESEAGKIFSQGKDYYPGTKLNLRKPANNQLYFSKEVPLDYGRYNSVKKGMSGQGYEGPYLVEVENVPMGASTKGRKPTIEPPKGKESYAVSHRPVSLDEAKFYKEDWLRGYKEIDVPKSNFKSEIDWGKWNPEIPMNKALMQEYNTIEKATKQSGTWMKNPDGSPFQGTPEQFVQQNSENFKKAFPNPVLDDAGNIQYNYHGSPNKFNEFDPNKFYSGDFGKGVYTSPDKEKILESYANFNRKRINKIREITGGTGNDAYLYELYFNSKNPKSFDDLSDVPFDIKNYGKSINDFSTRAELYKKYDKYLKENSWIKTDEDFDFLLDMMKDVPREKANLILPDNDFLKILDTPLKEQVAPFSNRPKSAIGNNGMFDMTNPNIYKAVAPIGTGIGVGASQINQKKYGGWLDKYQEGGETSTEQNPDRMQEIKIAATSPGVKTFANALFDGGKWLAKNFIKYHPGLRLTTKVLGTGLNYFKDEVFHKYRPIEYPDVLDAIIKLNNPSVEPLKDKKGNLSPSEEAWRKGLGFKDDFKYIKPASYKPSDSKDSDTEYVRFENMYDPQKLINAYVKAQKKLEPGETKVLIESLDPYIKGRKNLEASGVAFSEQDPLQNFTLDKGEDEKGKYISLYDVYDFGPLITDLVYGFKKPYEVYDRFYYEKNKQGIPVYKKKYGGWLDSYQDGGENLPELNSKIDVANFYRNLLSNKYGITQNPNTKAYEYYLRDEFDFLKKPKEEIESKKLEEINIKKRYNPWLENYAVNLSDVYTDETKQRIARNKEIGDLSNLTEEYMEESLEKDESLIPVRNNEIIQEINNLTNAVQVELNDLLRQQREEQRKQVSTTSPEPNVTPDNSSDEVNSPINATSPSNRYTSSKNKLVNFMDATMTPYEIDYLNSINNYCPSGDCLKTTKAAYDLISARLPGVKSSGELWEGLNIFSTNSKPTEEQIKKYPYFKGDQTKGAVDSWDIHGVIIKEGGVNLYNINKPSKIDYEKIPLGAVIGWGPKGKSTSYSNRAVGYNTEYDLQPSHHSTMVVGYTENKEPIVYDGYLGKYMPLSKAQNEIGKALGYELENISATKEAIQNTPGTLNDKNILEFYVPEFKPNLNNYLKTPNTTWAQINEDGTLRKPKFDIEKINSFSKSLQENKAVLMQNLNIDSNEYDKYAKLALAIAAQETEGGGSLGITDAAFSTVGMTQLNWNNIEANDRLLNASKKTYANGATLKSKTDLADPYKSAIATVIYLSQLSKDAERLYKKGTKENTTRTVFEPNLKTAVNQFVRSSTAIYNTDGFYIDELNKRVDLSEFEGGFFNDPNPKGAEKYLNSLTKNKGKYKVTTDKDGYLKITFTTKGNNSKLTDIEKIAYAWQSPSTLASGDAQGDSEYVKRILKYYKSL